MLLIGMPASGKTTAGKLLAKSLGYSFLDCDDLIRERTGKPLSQLISELGAEGFLQIEERVLLGVEGERLVVSPGGSICYSLPALERFRTMAHIVYLRLDEAEISRRIPSLMERGVVTRGACNTLHELYLERTPVYERYAEITIDCNNQTAEETVSAILAALKGCSGNRTENISEK